MKTRKGVHRWFAKWLHSIRHCRITIHNWVKNFRLKKKKKKKYVQISDNFFFEYRNSIYLDTRKIKIVRIFIITSSFFFVFFFFWSNEKFWYQFFIVIRLCFIDYNHLKKCPSNPLHVLGKLSKLGTLSLGYFERNYRIQFFFNISSKKKKKKGGSHMVFKVSNLNETHSTYYSKVNLKFLSDKKKEIMFEFRSIFILECRNSIYFDSQKINIFRNLTIYIYFCLIRLKFWNHSCIVIVSCFIECNHLKNHRITPLYVFNKWWKILNLAILLRVTPGTLKTVIILT